MFNFFKKKKETEVRSIEENMVYMASLGIPYDKILSYKETAEKIKEYGHSK